MNIELLAVGVGIGGAIVGYVLNGINNKIKILFDKTDLLQVSKVEKDFVNRENSHQDERIDDYKELEKEKHRSINEGMQEMKVEYKIINKTMQEISQSVAMIKQAILGDDTLTLKRNNNKVD